MILVYDVTSETTFRNVRAWMTSVRVKSNLLKMGYFKLDISFSLSKESAEDDCVVALVGNKTDLCDDDEKRPVKYKDGAKLADVNSIMKKEEKKLE